MLEVPAAQEVFQRKSHVQLRGEIDKLVVNGFREVEIMSCHVKTELRCPVCGAKELHPDGDKLLVRGFKLFDKGKWRSQCLVCSGYYDANLNINPLKDPTKALSFNNCPAAHRSSRGWF